MSPGVVNHFNGSTWTHTPTTVGIIDAIWRGGSVLWLAQPSEDGLTLRAFDGTTASPAQIAGVDLTQRAVDMTSLFGRGASDVWAAGTDVAHFDGQAWSLATDAPASARNTMSFDTNTFVTGDAGSVSAGDAGPPVLPQGHWTMTLSGKRSTSHAEAELERRSSQLAAVQFRMRRIMR